MVRGNHKPLYYLTRTEIDQLIKAIPDKRDKAIIFLAYSHGLRVSEVIALDRSDVDLKHGHITIARLKGSLPSVQPLNMTTKRFLKAYLKTRKDDFTPLFISKQKKRFDRGTLRKMMMKYGEKIGLQREKQNFHVLKHSIVTHLLEQTGDVAFVQNWVGHASIQSTQQYIHYADTHRNKIANDAFVGMGL